MSAEDIFVNEEALEKDMNVSISVDIKILIPDLIEDGVDGIIKVHSVSNSVPLDDAKKLMEHIKDGVVEGKPIIRATDI